MEAQLKAIVLVGFMAATLLTPAWAADEFTLTEEFVGYIKSIRNPEEWGRRADGRFYPYSRPQGRMIAYGQRDFDKRYYAEGMSAEEAETNLRDALEAALGGLRAYLTARHPEHPFDRLSRKSQEILLDLAFSEGAENLSDDVYAVVSNEDWNTMFNEFLYLRWLEKGWPYTIANKAFADRWLDPHTRHLPSANKISILLNKGYGE